MVNRPLRADAERSVRAILVAAEQILRTDPGATMEQIAEAAGVARTTVHRRFATREALLKALTKSVADRFAEAIDAAQTDTAPPVVALYQAAANVLRVKVDWTYTMSRVSEDVEVRGVYDHAMNQCEQVLRRARDNGLLRPDVDIVWASRVYTALVREAADDALAGEDLTDEAIAERASRVLDTLLKGVGTARAQI